LNVVGGDAFCLEHWLQVPMGVRLEKFGGGELAEADKTVMLKFNVTEQEAVEIEKLDAWARSAAADDVRRSKWTPVVVRDSEGKYPPTVRAKLAFSNRCVQVQLAIGQPLLKPEGSTFDFLKAHEAALRNGALAHVHFKPVSVYNTAGNAGLVLLVEDSLFRPAAREGADRGSRITQEDLERLDLQEED
jgi:hypothetical protein